MVKVPVIQYDFTAGLLDDSIVARKDLRVYYKGALQATNMIVHTSGRMQRRGGTRYRAEIAEAVDGARLARFEFSTEQTYLHVFLDQLVRVFMDGVAQADVVTPWTAAQLDGVDWTQQLDTMLVAHAAVIPKSLTRSGSHTAWTLADVAFTNLPTHRFGDETTSTGTPGATTGTGVSFTAGGNEFASGDVGKWIVGNQGRAKIATYVSPTQVNVDIVQDFKDATAIDAGDWSIEEEAWSTTRGWPSAVALYGGRSFWGGSETLLQNVWGSFVDKPFDHKITYEGLDDEAWIAVLDGKGVNAVRQIAGLDALMVFTTGGIWAVTDTPITPDALALKNSAVPAAKIQPIELEDAIAFISADEDGNPVSLHELLIDPDSTDKRYIPNPLNTLCEQAVADPVDMTVRKAVRLAKGRAAVAHVFVVNGDGSVGVLHSRRREKVLAWTLWQTPGNAGDDAVQRAAVVGNTLWLLVKRTIDGTARYFLEEVDDDAFFDCSVAHSVDPAQSVFSGFDHLDGETVAVWADGARRDDAVVSGGEVTVTDGGEAIEVSEMEAGLPFDWTLQTMPVEAQLIDGTLIGEAHRMVYATLRLRDAYDLTVNGRRVALRPWRGLTFDTPPEPFTGTKRVRFTGWRNKQALGGTVTMTGELPITIESVAIQVAQ